MMTRDEVESLFALSGKELDGATVLAGTYAYDSSEGAAMVVFTRDGKLYEVHGSHCSCNGLEGQWYPEETSVPAIQDRLEKSSDYYRRLFGEEFVKELITVTIGEIFEKEILGKL